MKIPGCLKQFTLIEWMIIFAILGILAAIAVPYLDPHREERAELAKAQALAAQRGVVTQFSATGDKIGEWNMYRFLGVSEGRFRFETEDGKKVTVTGTYKVEQ